MPVSKPKKRLGKGIRLKFAKKGGHGGTSPIADLNVTPMVDMLTMLVIFLLMTFSATGEILFISKDIVLPKAFNAVSLERAPVVAASAQSVAFEGEFVMNTADIDVRYYADWNLQPLYKRLELERKTWEEQNPDKAFDGQVIVQSDGNVQFSVIKMLIFTCAQAGYANVNFAVQQSTVSPGL